MRYSPLITTKIAKNSWTLHVPWETPFVTVPSGFVTDGASIPRILWVFASPSGELFEAAIVHDYMYENSIQSKEAADLAFYLTALHFKVTPWKAKLAYYAVKLLGRGRYA